MSFWEKFENFKDRACDKEGCLVVKMLTFSKIVFDNISNILQVMLQRLHPALLVRLHLVIKYFGQLAFNFNDKKWYEVLYSFIKSISF